ncbi:unnamed protein product [Ophioblennius macclurei]
MKTVVLAALLLLLCSTQVLTLRCNTCDGDDCKMETDCPSTAQYCKTVTLAGDIVSRTCEEMCEEDDFTSCCSEDLC